MRCGTATGRRENRCESRCVGPDGAFATYPELAAEEVLGTHRAVEVSATLDGHPFAATLMPSGAGPHRLPLRKALCATVGKDQAGQPVEVHLRQRTT